MFSGSLVAIVTPLRADGALDVAAWGRLLDFHAQSGTSGVVVGGSTGESGSLSDGELCDLVGRACAQLKGKMPVIAGVATSCTATTVERVRLLAGIPVDGIMVVAPPYVRPTQEGLYRHYSAIAAAASAPVIVYNVPARTAVDVLPQTVARLAQVAGIVALKEAVADLGRIRELIDRCGSDFAVLTGDDPTSCRAILAGAKGVISVTANVAPRPVADMVAAAARGDRVVAQRIDSMLAPLNHAAFVEPNPIPIKWALARMGLIDGALRLPLTELSGEHHATVLQALRTVGVLNG